MHAWLHLTQTPPSFREEEAAEVGPLFSWKCRATGWQDGTRRGPKTGPVTPPRPWASPPSCPSDSGAGTGIFHLPPPRGRRPARRAGRTLPGCTGRCLSPARRQTEDAEVNPGSRRASSGRPGGGPWARGRRWCGAAGPSPRRCPAPPQQPGQPASLRAAPPA